jgi:hypothetical protein
MQNTQCFTQLIRRAMLAALVTAPALGAQETYLYTWRGVVDDDVRIAMRSGSIQSSIVSGDQASTRARVSRVAPLPRREGIVRIELIEGRGLVRVVQQPSASNGYTAIVQVKDAAGGAAPYRFRTTFEPTTVTTSRRGRIISDVGGEVDLVSGSPVFRWTGNIDGTVDIAIRRGSARYSVLSGAEPRNVQSGVLSGGLPYANGRLSLAPRQGRGNITILQQPSASNDYTAIIRVSDPDTGFGYYDFDVIWR